MFSCGDFFSQGGNGVEVVIVAGSAKKPSPPVRVSGLGSSSLMPIIFLAMETAQGKHEYRSKHSRSARGMHDRSNAFSTAALSGGLAVKSDF